MTNEEKKSQLTKYYLDKIPYQFRTQYNLELIRVYINALINSGALFENFLDILNIDKMEGKSLDFIGETLIGIDRSSVPFYDVSNNAQIIFNDIIFEDFILYEGEIQENTVLSDVNYRIILKFALIVKNITFSLPNINTAFKNFFGNGVYVCSKKPLTLSFVFDSSVFSKVLIQNLKAKNLIPAPAGVSIELWYLPAGKKFFSFPIFYQNNLPVYREFEQGFGGILYHNDFLI